MKLLRWMFVGVLLLQVVACATGKPPVQKRYFWPPLSDDPKIEYVTFFQSDRDVNQLGGNPVIEAVFGHEHPKPLFRNPFSVSSNGSGKLYVSEVARRYVLVLDLIKGTVGYLKGGDPGQPLFKMPTGVAGDLSGKVYVVDSQAHKVMIFGPDDSLVDEWMLGDEVARPLNLAVDAERGRVALVDVDQHKVLVLDLRDGKTLFSFGGHGLGEGEFNFPLDVDIDGAGNLYVLDAMNARIQVFSPDGKYLRSFGERGTAIGSFQVPKGIAISPAGQVYVTDSMANRLVVFSLEGDYLMTIGGKFAALDGQIAPGGFYLPGGIDVDKNNSIWVVDALNRIVHQYQFLDEDYLQKHPILPGQAVQPEVR